MPLRSWADDAACTCASSWRCTRDAPPERARSQPQRAAHPGLKRAAQPQYSLAALRPLRMCSRPQLQSGAAPSAEPAARTEPRSRKGDRGWGDHRSSPAVGPRERRGNGSHPRLEPVIDSAAEGEAADGAGAPSSGDEWVGAPAGAAGGAFGAGTSAPPGVPALDRIRANWLGGDLQASEAPDQPCVPGPDAVCRAAVHRRSHAALGRLYSLGLGDAVCGAGRGRLADVAGERPG